MVAAVCGAEESVHLSVLPPIDPDSVGRVLVCSCGFFGDSDCSFGEIVDVATVPFPAPLAPLSPPQHSAAGKSRNCDAN